VGKGAPGPDRHQRQDAIGRWGSHRMNSTADTENPFKRVQSNAFERVLGNRP
jgi:hypothetical protein